MTLIIRRTQPSDAQALCALYEPVSIYSNTMQLPFPSVELWQKRLLDLPDNVHSLVAVMGGEVVGNMGLTLLSIERRRHVATFGVTVKATAQGQGVGKALIQAALDLADNWLNIRRIEIFVYTDNERAIGLYKKMGFVIEGELIDFGFRGGNYVNAYQMARIRQI